MVGLQGFIPDICHFFYTDKIFGEKIYTEARKNDDNRISRQSSANACWQVIRYHFCQSLPQILTLIEVRDCNVQFCTYVSQAMTPGEWMHLWREDSPFKSAATRFL